jgi:hypothetical protein
MTGTEIGLGIGLAVLVGFGYGAWLWLRRQLRECAARREACEERWRQARERVAGYPLGDDPATADEPWWGR